LNLDRLAKEVKSKLAISEGTFKSASHRRAQERSKPAAREFSSDDAELIKRYGEPYSVNKDNERTSDLNQKFFVARFAAKHQMLHEGTSASSTSTTRRTASGRRARSTRSRTCSSTS
jgi:hypothetical protein